MNVRTLAIWLFAAALCNHASLVMSADADQAEAAAEPEPLVYDKMGDEARSAARAVIVVAGTYAPQKSVTGSYQQHTDGLVAGAEKGRQIGRVVTDIYGIPVGYQISILSTLGQIFGGARGLSKEKLQRFRDRLTRDIAENADVQLNDDSLASDVFWRIRELPAVQPKILNRDKPIPADTDAVIHVGITGMVIAVDKSRATITTSALATVEDAATGNVLYQADVSYADADELKNWTADDHAAWRSYAVYARHFLAQEIAAELYERKVEPIPLRPGKSADIKPDRKMPWRGSTRVAQPTLVWERDGAANSGDPQPVGYDLEIYDHYQQVFAEPGIAAMQYTLPVELPGCGSYRWSVRPRYLDGDKVYVGEWMRKDLGQQTRNGSEGKHAAAAPAFLYDFPLLDVSCRR